MVSMSTKKLSNKKLYLQFWRYSTFVYYFSYIPVWVELKPRCNWNSTQKCCISKTVSMIFFVCHFFFTQRHHKSQNWEDDGYDISKIIFRTLRRGERINDIHPCCKFTCELEVNSLLLFLDCLLTHLHDGQLSKTASRPTPGWRSVLIRANPQPPGWESSRANWEKVRSFLSAANSVLRSQWTMIPSGLKKILDGCMKCST